MKTNFYFANNETIRILCSFCIAALATANPNSVLFMAALPSVTILVRTLHENWDIAAVLDEYPMYSEKLALMHTAALIAELAHHVRLRLRYQIHSLFAASVNDTVNCAVDHMKRHLRKRQGVDMAQIITCDDSNLFSVEPLSSEELYSTDIMSILLDTRPELLRYIACILTNQTPPTLLCDVHIRGIRILKDYYRQHNMRLRSPDLALVYPRKPQIIHMLISLLRFHVEYCHVIATTQFAVKQDGIWKVDPSIFIKPKADSFPVSKSSSLIEPNHDNFDSLLNETDTVTTDDPTETIDRLSTSLPINFRSAQTDIPPLPKRASEFEILEEKKQQLQNESREKAARLIKNDQKRQEELLRFVVVLSIIMPDTNCFLDDTGFKAFLKLLGFLHFQVIIPITGMKQFPFWLSDDDIKK